MATFILGQLLLVSAILLVFVAPGFAIVSFLERKRGSLSPFERVVSWPALGTVTVTFLMIVMGTIGIPLSAVTVGSGIAIISAFFLILAQRTGVDHTKADVPVRTVPKAALVVFAALLVIKTLYLVPTLIPNSTDLGHHLFWVEKIAATETLPTYEARDIVTDGSGTSTIAEAHPISDFIIGEHLALAAIRMLSGRDFTTPAAVIALFFIHILSLLAAYALARRLFDHVPFADTVATWTLLLLGAFYAFGPPQLKYIEGGVIGNTFGNLLIPVIFLLLIVAIRERRPEWFATSVVLAFGLAYTHHLSALIFALSAAVTGALFLALERKKLRESVVPLLADRRTIAVFAACLLFLSFVHLPSYLRNSAVETVVGTAEKSEHLGLPFSKLIQISGDPRMAFGLLGLVLIAAFRTVRRADTLAVLVGWTTPLFLLSLWPDLVRMDLPSARVANYLETPLAIAAAFAIVLLSERFRERVRAPKWIMVGSLFLLVTAVSWNGTADNLAYLAGGSDRNERSFGIFAAGAYLRDRIDPDMVIVHDHMNMPGNSFLKVFLLRDYNFPFYRALLMRYERDDRQETCTLNLISAPDSEAARRCADDLNARVFVVDAVDDGAQFDHSKRFSKVYSDPFHAAYLDLSDTPYAH